MLTFEKGSRDQTKVHWLAALFTMFLVPKVLIAVILLLGDIFALQNTPCNVLQNLRKPSPKEENFKPYSIGTWGRTILFFLRWYGMGQIQIFCKKH